MTGDLVYWPQLYSGPII